MHSVSVPHAIDGIPVELVTTDAGELWFLADDEVMRLHAFKTGSWDTEVGNLIKRICPPSGAVFLDVGANVGYFSRFVARFFPDSEIHAFEPHPKIFGVLELNAWPAPQIVTHAVALGDERSNVVLSSTPKNLGDTRASRPTVAQQATIVAPVISLDELLPTLRADVVKIDVQGYELAVIKGMAALIRRSPNIRIILEFSPSILTEMHINPEAVLDAYRSMGFSVTLISGMNLAPATNQDVLAFCYCAGPEGQANLLLSRR